ncbi:hypothetical protein CF319_g8233 [Tilletia indica]|nr:hypothetical protein CF319_g8233 [Tilletia indica]
MRSRYQARLDLCIRHSTDYPTAYRAARLTADQAAENESGGREPGTGSHTPTGSATVCGPNPSHHEEVDTGEDAGAAEAQQGNWPSKLASGADHLF